MSLLKLLAASSLLLLSSLACETLVRIVTPSSVPPTALYGTQTPLPVVDDTQTPTSSPTSSISEITGTPATPTSTPFIIEIMTPIGATISPPGWVNRVAGIFVPRRDLYRRSCPSTSCQPLPGSGLFAGRSYPTQGWVQNEAHELWVCEQVTEDEHGARLCLSAVAWWISSEVFGSYFEKGN